jgi:hypothetical protein
MDRIYELGVLLESELEISPSSVSVTDKEELRMARKRSKAFHLTGLLVPGGRTDNPRDQQLRRVTVKMTLVKQVWKPGFTFRTASSQSSS